MIVDDADPRKLDGCCDGMTARLRAPAGRPRVVVGPMGLDGRRGLLVDCGLQGFVPLSYCPFCGEKVTSKAPRAVAEARTRSQASASASEIEFVLDDDVKQTEP